MAEAATVIEGQDTQGGAGANDAWYGAYDDDTKGFVTAKGWDKLTPEAARDEAIKGYRGAEQKLGVPADQVLKLPGKDAKPEDWQAVYRKLGAPEKPEEYGLSAPEGHDGAFLQTAVTWFHELGVPKNMAAGLAEKWNGYVQAAQEAELGKWNQRHDEEMNALKGTWKGDEFDKQTDLAKRVMRTAGFTPEQLQAMERALGPKALLEGFAKFGSAIGEHRFVGGNQPQNFGGMSPEAAKQRIVALRSDTEFQKKIYAGDVAANKEWTDLHEAAFGTDPVSDTGIAA